MHPIERLRWVARAGDGDPAMLAAEAVHALGDLAGDPRALVMAATRLVGAHPECGPLWWSASRLLVATEPRAEAAELAALLGDDETAEELAAAYPSSAVLACEASACVVDSLAGRPDLTAHLVGAPWDLQMAMRALAGGGEVLGWTGGALAGALAGATLCCVEAQAAGPAGAVVAPAGAALARAARDAAIPVWLVAATGRVLPEALFDALVRRCASAPERGALVEAATFDALVGPGGLVAVADGLAAGAGPVATELTR